MALAAPFSLLGVFLPPRDSPSGVPTATEIHEVISSPQLFLVVLDGARGMFKQSDLIFMGQTQF